MKTLILGDIHGHTSWESIIKKEKPNKVIFLGDYVDTFDVDNTYEMQINNLERILDYKEKRGNKCILLLGNHDYHYITNTTQRYSGYNPGTHKLMKTIEKRFLENVQLIYVDKKNKTIFSHAGVSNYWLEDVAQCKLNEVNNISLKSEKIGFNYYTGYNPYGDTISQSPIWIRPKSLLDDGLIGYNQVVGHTHMRDNNIFVKEYKENCNFYFCDTLPGQYLVSEDGNFVIKNNN